MSEGSRGLTPIERCRSCGSRELSMFLSLGDLPLSNGLLSADQLAAEEPRYPLDVAILQQLLAGADHAHGSARGTVRCRLSLPVVLHRRGCAQRRAERRDAPARAPTRPLEPRRRACEQRRLPAPALRRGWRAGPGHRADAGSRGRGPRSGRGDDRRFFRARPGRPTRSERPPGRRHPCQQRAGARCGHERLRRRDRGVAQAGWHCRHRGALRTRAHRSRRVRHDLS